MVGNATPIELKILNSCLSATLCLLFCLCLLFFKDFLLVVPTTKQKKKLSPFPCTTCRSILVDQKQAGFLHHNQIPDVIIEKSDCDVENLIVMQEAHRLLAYLSWICHCGRGNCHDFCSQL